MLVSGPWGARCGYWLALRLCICVLPHGVFRIVSVLTLYAFVRWVRHGSRKVRGTVAWMPALIPALFPWAPTLVPVYAVWFRHGFRRLRRAFYGSRVF